MFSQARVASQPVALPSPFLVTLPSPLSLLRSPCLSPFLLLTAKVRLLLLRYALRDYVLPYLALMRETVCCLDSFRE